MRIEVLIGNDDPIIFPLKSTKVVIGSSEQCDVVLETGGVSRKHISVISEEDRFFVVDMGSTNGSFINEERLIPGKKVEFTSFFPVRLGSDVLVSLISDDENDFTIDIPASFKDRSSPAIKVPVPEEKTSVISLADLNKVKTESLVKNRNTKRAAIKKKASKEVPSKPKKKGSFLPTLAVFLVVGAGFYNYRNREIVEEIPNAEIGQIIKKEVVEPVAPKVSEYLIPENDLIKKENYKKLTNTLKCTTDREKYLCGFFPGANAEPFGVVQVGLTQHVLIDGSPYFEEAKKLVKKPIDNSPVSVEEYNKLVLDTGIYLYLMRMNQELDQGMLKDMNLSIAFFEGNNEKLEVSRVLAIKPEVFPLLKDIVKEDNLRFIKSNGLSALNLTKDYYTTY